MSDSIISVSNVYHTLEDYSKVTTNKFELVVLMTSYLLSTKNENYALDANSNTGYYMKYIIGEMINDKVDLQFLNQCYLSYGSNSSQKHGSVMRSMNSVEKVENKQKEEKNFFDSEDSSLSDL